MKAPQVPLQAFAQGLAGVLNLVERPSDVTLATGIEGQQTTLERKEKKI